MSGFSGRAGEARRVDDAATGRCDHGVEWLFVARLSSGMALRIPMITIEGASPGPTVGLMAGVHGDEHTGTECVRRLLAKIDPARMAGRVRAIPVANPLAFEARTRHTPLDGANLNRVFPGTPTGWLTEQLADVITRHFLTGLDHLIDFHAAGDGGLVDYLITQDVEAGLACGAEHIYVGPSFEGTSGRAAKSLGCRTTLTPELGGIDCSPSVFTQKGVTWAGNAMRHWGMRSGDPVLPARQVVFRRKEVSRPTHGGLLYHNGSQVALGSEVPEGTVLGSIVSPYTFEVLEVLRAPFARNLVIHVRAYDGRVHPGDYAFQCADLSTAEVHVNADDQDDGDSRSPPAHR